MTIKQDREPTLKERKNAIESIKKKAKELKTTIGRK